MVFPWKKRKKPIFVVNKKVYDNPYFPKEIQDDRMVYGGIIILVLCFVIFFIFFGGYFNVEAVNIAGNQHIQKETIESFAENWKNQKVLWIIPRSNALFFNTEKFQSSLNESLESSFSLKDLSVKRSSWHTISITLSERIPGLLYIPKTEEQYLVDKEGILGERITLENNQNQDFPKIFDKNQRAVNLGEKIFSDAFLSFIIQLTELIPQKTSFEIESFELPEVQCQEKQYILERTQIKEGESQDVYTHKKEVLQKYEQKIITLEEALQMLQDKETKESDDGTRDENNPGNSKKAGESSAENDSAKNNAVREKVRVKSVFHDKPCDYLKVLTEIHVKTREGPALYFETSENIDTQINNLIMTLKNLPQPEDREYIDIRFKNRAYYK